MIKDMNTGHLKRVLESIREDMATLESTYKANREKLAIAEEALLTELKGKIALEKEREKR